jgi:hypothetical protein
MKLGLYSITYLGLWYRGKELTQGLRTDFALEVPIS